MVYLSESGTLRSQINMRHQPSQNEKIATLVSMTSKKDPLVEVEKLAGELATIESRRDLAMVKAKAAGKPAPDERPVLAFQIHRLCTNAGNALQSRNCLEIPVDRKHLPPLPGQPAGVTTATAGEIEHFTICRNSHSVVHDPCGRR